MHRRGKENQGHTAPSGGVRGGASAPEKSRAAPPRCPLLQPVSLGIGGAQVQGEYHHQNHAQKTRSKKTQEGKEVKPDRMMASAGAGGLPAERQQKQESGGHPDAHLEEPGPEVSPGDGDHELPQHLHGAGEKADSGAQHEQRAVKALSRTDGREPEEHHRDQIHQCHGDAEAPPKRCLW